MYEWTIHLPLFSVLSAFLPPVHLLLPTQHTNVEGAPLAAGPSGLVHAEPGCGFAGDSHPDCRPALTFTTTSQGLGSKGSGGLKRIRLASVGDVALEASVLERGWKLEAA